MIRRVATAPRTGDMAAEFPFLAEHAHVPTKYTMAAPSYHRRYWSDTVSKSSCLRTAGGVPHRDSGLAA